MPAGDASLTTAQQSKNPLTAITVSTAFDFPIRLGSSTADLKVTATTGPTPGTVISRRQTASSRTIASTALCSFSYCAFKRCPRRKHRLSNALQRGLTCHQFPNPRFKRLAGHLPDLQAEAAQDAPNAQFHIQQPSEKLLARNQQPSDLLRSNRFGVYRPEPPHPDQLCKPACILAVRLHRHR